MNKRPPDVHGRPLTVEDLWAIPMVGDPAPSPDGQWAVVPVRHADMEANESVWRLWRVAPGEPAQALTDPERSAQSPALSPDGKRLAFVRSPGGEASSDGTGPRHPDQKQLWVMSTQGGEAVRLTDVPLGVADPRWFPDGRRIACLVGVYRDAPDVDAAADRSEALQADPVGAHVTEDRVYRYWDRWLTDGAIHHVSSVDAQSGDLVDLTPSWGEWLSLWDPADSYRIAPDGRQIAFSALRTQAPYDLVANGVFTVDLDGSGRPGPVTDRTRHIDGTAIRPVYSPDGRMIVYGLRRELDFYADKVRLVALDLASDRHTVLTEGWDGSAEAWAFADDQQLVFAAEWQGRRVLYGLDLAHALRDSSEATPIRLTDSGSIGSPRPAGASVWATHQSLSQPPEVVRIDVGKMTPGTDLTRMTGFTRDAMAGIALGRVSEITVAGAEGREVQAWLVEPPAGVRGADDPAVSASPASSAAGADRPPLVHMIHGGPHGAFGDQWHARWNAQAFAAPGHVVALVNFHGSTGWGQDFTASILGRWGEQPYADVIAVTDRLVEDGVVDPDRMAVTGGSYGGYLVTWITSQTDRFACAVNHAGVADFQVQYATDVTQGRRRSMGGEPWDNLAGMDRYNPFRQAAGFDTPMLILHGMQDFRVPYAHGLALYNVLKAKGVPARLVVYPDENHWILKPKSSRHWYGQVLGWLDRWLS